jgi:[ribosomal protein S5]-alanine N-acetyltransferase
VFIERATRGWVDGAEYIWSIWLREAGPLAGMMSLRPQGPTVNIGYALAKSCWRQGFMSEVLRALIPSLLAQPSIWRVWAVCDVENVASAGLLERVGMQREGVLRRWTIHPNLSPEPRDCFCYSITK